MAELSRYGIRTVKGLNFKKFGRMPTADYRYGTVRSPNIVYTIMEFLERAGRVQLLFSLLQLVFTSSLPFKLNICA